MIDRLTGKSKGYGFVTLDSAATAERVLAAPQHKIGERLVEVAAPRGPVRATSPRLLHAAARRAAHRPLAGSKVARRYPQ